MTVVRWPLLAYVLLAVVGIVPGRGVMILIVFTAPGQPIPLLLLLGVGFALLGVAVGRRHPGPVPRPVRWAFAVVGAWLFLAAARGGAIGFAQALFACYCSLLATLAMAGTQWWRHRRGDP